MLTAFLFLVASLVVIAFIIIKILNPTEENRLSKEEVLRQFDPEKEWDIGAFLLKLGPVIAGFGLVGWIATEWWDQPDTRLLLIALITVILYAAAGILYTFGTKNRSLGVFGEAALLIASFMLGGVLYAANDVYTSVTGFPLFGIAEMFGIWFMVNLLVAYLSKSTWTLGVNVFVVIVWLTGYLNPNFNFAPLVGIRDGVMFASPYTALAIPAVTVSATAALYAWHQKMNHQVTGSGWRSFYYLSGLFSFLIVGALIFRSIDLYNAVFEQAELNAQILLDVLMMIVALVAFGIDFVLKKSVRGYNVNYLAAALVPVASLASLVAFPNAIFTGLFFIEVPFVIWILADYLRQKSPLAAPIFYSFNAIQLFALATNDDTFNWFKIIVMLAILMYASVVHYLNRPLAYYTMIIGIITLLVKVIATGANEFLMVVLSGTVLMAFGVFYTQTRSRMIAYQKKIATQEDHNPFSL